MRILRIVLIAYLVAFAALIVLVRLAAPGPAGQAIQGVRIGEWNGQPGNAYFSGKRLRCEPLIPPSEYTGVCYVDIAGERLALYARVRQDGEPPMNALGVCMAEYRGRRWPCQLQSHFNSPGAPTAYISEPLGLDAAQLAAIRQRFPIENASEGNIVKALVLLWPVTAAALIVTALTFWPKERRGKVLDGIGITLFGVAVTLGLPLALMVAARGFWD